jgi:hypothetical protein
VPRDFKVITPMATLYARDGVDVALIGIEVWSSGIIVRLGGLPNERTDALDRTFRNDLEAWGRAEREGQPPKHPTEWLFDVGLALSNDVGTSYELQSGVRGGAGRMLRAEWAFEPGPPDSASRLTLVLSGDKGHQGSVDIEI